MIGSTIKKVNLVADTSIYHQQSIPTKKGLILLLILLNKLDDNNDTTSWRQFRGNASIS